MHRAARHPETSSMRSRISAGGETGKHEAEFASWKNDPQEAGSTFADKYRRQKGLACPENHQKPLSQAATAPSNCSNGVGRPDVLPTGCSRPACVGRIDEWH